MKMVEGFEGSVTKCLIRLIIIKIINTFGDAFYKVGVNSVLFIFKI